ncbi:MAG: hypothetical protein AAGM38_13835 [Pseudomonadota bacterium]
MTSRLSPLRARLLGAAAAAALFAAAPAAAEESGQTLRLGAGEHGGYSRVVLNNGPRGGWTAASRPQGLELKLPGEAWRVDARAVNEMRRAHRVERVDVRREDGWTVLDFAFACDCAATPRALASGLVVLDVTARAAGASADAAAERDGRIETASLPAPEAAAPIARAADATPPGSAPLDVQGAQLYFIEKLQRAAAEGLVRFRDDAPAAGVAADPAPVAEAPQTPTRAQAETQAQTETPRAPNAEAPSAAATLPVVTGDAAAPLSAPRAPQQAPAPEIEPRAPSPAAARAEAFGPAAPSPDARPSPPAAPPAAPRAVASSAPPLAQRRGAEPAMAEADAAAPMVDEAPLMLAACPRDELLDIASWENKAPYGDALAARRGALLSQLGRIDPLAVAALQSLYLWHGFGAEAAAAPRTYDVDDPDVIALAAAGDVLAGRPPAEGSTFNRPTECGGRHALWQAAALSDVDPAAALAAYDDGAKRALLATPQQLRRTLGERIALAAAREGDMEALDAVMAVLERSQRPPTAAMRIGRAALAESEGRTVAAQRDLERVAYSREPVAFEAALRLADTLTQPYDAGRALQLANRLQDFALQRRADETLLDAVSTEAALRSRFGRFAEALAAVDLAQRYGGLAAEDLEALRVSLLDEANARLRATEGADQALADADAPPSPLDGLAIEHAAQLVDAAARLPAGPENDRIRAELAETLTVIGAPHLAPLLVDESLLARSPEALAALEAANEASALIDPLGAMGDGPDLLGVAALVAEQDRPIETADAPPPPIDPMTALLGRPTTGPATTIEDGEALVNEIDQDLELLRQIMAEQLVPAEAPNFASMAPLSEGDDTDG